MWIVFFLACSDYDFKKVTDGVGSDDLGDTAIDSTGNNNDSDSASGFDTADNEEPDIATEVIYLHSDTQLFSWEPGGAKILVGNFSQSDVRMTDIAIDLDGNMFGVASTLLYRIDAQTAEVFYICSMDQYANGLAFISDGRLLAAGDGIFYVDTLNCNTTGLSVSGGYQTSGDLVGIPGERLFWTVTGSSGDGLVEVNPNTGAASFVGTISIGNLWGVGYSDGLLYGFSSNGNAAVIDPDSASTLAVENISGTWWGATTNPIRW